MEWKRKEIRYRDILDMLSQDPRIRELEKYPQHEVTNSFVHSHNVAVYAFHLARKKDWGIDLNTLALGAMLHDYYLYDIKESGLTDYQHGVRHPVTALENAGQCFDIDDKVKNIILSHMWPLPFVERPKSREAVLVNLADKYCAYQEMKNGIVHIEDVIKSPYRLKKGQKPDCFSRL